MTLFDEAKSLSSSRSVSRPKSKAAKSQARWGWFFISPWLIGFIGLYLLPMIASLVFMFTDFSLIDPENIKFVGLDNIKRLFIDQDLRQALGVTVKFFLLAIPLAIFHPVLFAAMLNAKSLWGKRFFTTLFYFTSMVPLVATIIIWNGMLNPQTGWINRVLDAIGINGPDWVNSTTWIYPSLILIGLWGVGNAMLYTLIGMQNVPSELYEAAKVDGAGPVRSFFAITFPMITPIIFYNMVLAVVGLFQYFTIPYILSRGTGAPGGATNFYNVYFFKTAFTYFDMGYAAALAWLLFFIAMTLTLILFWSSKYWVYSPGGKN